MNIHVISTGTEILIGHTLNTNLAFLGAMLNAEGYVIRRECCVSDRAADIGSAVRDELAAADLVLTIGGLGPTSDDLTRDVVAAVLGAPLHFDAAVHAAIVTYLGERSVKVPPQALRTQAMIPENATPLINRNGTAPGLWCPRADGKIVVMLPGPPRELQPMFLEDVLPRLRALAEPEIMRRGFTVCGIPESVVADKVELLLTEFPGIEPAYCARLGQVDVRLSAPPAKRPLLEDATRLISAAFGQAVLAEPAANLAQVVGALLQAKGLWLATAESCTGGSIAKEITDVAGASAFFSGGIVSYSNDWKQTLLDVREDTLTQQGAVSAAAATEMLNALFRRYEADAGIAVTGIAGPAGGTPDKPVGLVFIATGVRGKRQVEQYSFPGNREAVRQRTVTTALNQLRLQLLEL